MIAGEMTSRPAPARRRAVTLMDIADLAGVSRATVSLVLRDSPLVAAATRARVEASIAAAGYVYNRGAARLRTGLSGTVGLVVPEITNPFYAELTAGIDRTLDLEGRLAFLANTGEMPERQERFIRRIREQGADGIILCATEGTPSALLDSLRDARIACVQILRRIEGGLCDFVGPDYETGVFAALDHLERCGHRRIALVPSSKHTSAARDRIGAYRAWMVQRGRAPDLIVPCKASRTEAAGALEVLLDRSDPPTAIVCHNDLVALGIMGALVRRGLRPGPDMAVIGFDDVPEASNSWPALSTVATGAAVVGIEAARLLLRRIAAPDAAREEILIAPTLIVRDT